MKEIQLVEEVLGAYRDDADIVGYRNHVYRVIDFCFTLAGTLSETDRKKIIIAACFHDLGLFSDDTFNYLPPSISLADSYLSRNDLGEWQPEISAMIDQHHRVRSIKDLDQPLVELFRKADLIDFSFGIIRFGVPRSRVTSLKAEFANAGFHKCLARKAFNWIRQHPLRPVPVLKW